MQPTRFVAPLVTVTRAGWRSVAGACAVAAIAAADIGAQANAGPPVRKLAAPVRTSTTTFVNVQHLNRLNNGRVLVNDASRRQVLMFDSTLSNPVVVIDSAGGQANSYGLRPGGLLPFRGDSTLFVDATSNVFLVITPEGRVGRVMSVPSTNSSLASYLVSPASYGYPGYSEAFGLVFREAFSSSLFNRLPRPAEGAPAVTMRVEDSVTVLAMKIATRRVDTLARLSTGSVQTITMTYNSSMSSGTPALFPVADDWAVMADGSVAILSGREYRVYWQNADGTRTPGPRIPYPWRHLTDDDKQHVVDSINAARLKSYQDRLDMLAKSAEAARVADSVKAEAAKNPQAKAAAGKDSATKATTVGGRGAPVPVSSSGTVLSASSGMIRIDGVPMFIEGLGAGRVGGPGAPPSPPAKVEITEVPDYLPAVDRTGAIRADADNNLWIRPRLLKPTPGAGLIYDIVNRKGELVDRVQLPVGRTILGFGKGRIVYLSVRDAGSMKIEEVRF